MNSRKLLVIGVTTACLSAAPLVGRAAAQSTDQSAQTGAQTGTPPEPPPGPPGPGPGRGMGMGGPMGMPFGGGFGGPMMPGGGEPVTGAPYSAEAVTEITQTLSDGNRIVKKVTASVYRDSAGRVRRDQVLAAVGSWMPDAQPKTVFIDDPVAHFHYILNADKQTAFRFPAPDRGAFRALRGGANGSPNGSQSSTSTSTSTGTNTGSTTNATSTASDEPAPRHRGPGTVTKTSLGTQTIEGVQATGTQSVLTIEAGAIGNDQAIRIVSEEWYSPDLKTVVLSKRSDPRFGETVYQLTQISRAEPDPTLFQVPSNYTVTDAKDRPRHPGGPPRPGRRPE